MVTDQYFAHDYSSTTDPKISALLSDYGDWGYGLYWRIIEVLHREGNHVLPLKDFIFRSFAGHKSTSVEQVRTFVESCINDYELFVENQGVFYSNRVNRNIEKRTSISVKRSEAGIKSAIARQAATSVEQNPTKEKKGKEIKEKNTNTGIAFLDFWQLYDKKVGEKGKVEKKWDSLKPEEQQAIMEHLPEYKAAQPDKQYRKNPEVYLNNRSWNDEIIKSKAAAPTLVKVVLGPPRERDFWNQQQYLEALEKYNQTIQKTA